MHSVDAIPGYRIVRELGHGGMATVYLAVQESLQRQVALKLLSPALAADPQAAERFLREGRIAAKLTHRHIVSIHDVGVHAGQPYLAMEYLPGGTLAAPMPPAQAMLVLREVAFALEHAQAHGVVHRDIKPENILRREDGSYALSDFGIARAMDAGSGMTQEGVTIGTPHYMSPEQLQGLAVDGRSDLYSLGVLFYQLLTGQLPYRGTDGWAIGMQHISAPLPQLPEALAAFQPIVSRLMAKDPAQRPSSGRALVDWLERSGWQNSGAQPTLAMPLARTGRPRRTLFAIAVTAMLMLGSVWAWRHWAASSPAPSATAATAAADSVAIDSRSIAVLPLLNMGGAAGDEYFSDGLAETILDMLARVPELKVIARTSSFAFKGKNIDVREIGRQLDVAHLLEGSVQRAGDRVRITAQLVRTSDGAHLWSQRYDRRIEDVFAIQDEIAAEVVKAIQGKLNADAALAVGNTANLLAYQEYLQGMSLLPRRNPQELQQALTHFQKAIELDPGYARAYVGAAINVVLLRAYIGERPEQLALARHYVVRAKELAPGLGEAFVAEGAMLESLQEDGAALQAYAKGVSLSPGFALGWQWYGELLMRYQGDVGKAVEMLEHARALDPLAPMATNELGFAYLEFGNLDRAEEMARLMAKNHPDVPLRFMLESAIILARGDVFGALRTMSLAKGRLPDRLQYDHCSLITDLGAIALAERCIREIGKKYGQGVDYWEAWARFFDKQGRFAEAMAAIESGGLSGSDDWDRADLLVRVGRAEEAVRAFRRMVPELFAPEVDVEDVGYPGDPLSVALALQATGKNEDRAQAMHLLQIGLNATRARKHYHGSFGRAGIETFYLFELGQFRAACDAMKDAIAAGQFLDFGPLQTDPRYAPLRATACYAEQAREIRRRADDVLARAKAEGLLEN